MVTDNLGFESDPDRNRTCDLRFRNAQIVKRDSPLIGESGPNRAENRPSRHGGATAKPFRPVSAYAVEKATRVLLNNGYLINSRVRIYLVADPIRGLIKIGSTAQLPARMRALRLEHGPVGFIASAPGSRGIEWLLHHAFRDARASGEWFNPVEPLVGFARDLATAKTDWIAAELVMSVLGHEPLPESAAPRFGRKRLGTIDIYPETPGYEDHKRRFFVERTLLPEVSQ